MAPSSHLTNFFDRSIECAINNGRLNFSLKKDLISNPSRQIKRIELQSKIFNSVVLVTVVAALIIITLAQLHYLSLNVYYTLTFLTIPILFGVIRLVNEHLHQKEIEKIEECINSDPNAVLNTSVSPLYAKIVLKNANQFDNLRYTYHAIQLRDSYSPISPSEGDKMLRESLIKKAKKLLPEKNDLDLNFLINSALNI